MSFVVGVDLDNSAEEKLAGIIEMCDDVTPEIIQALKALRREVLLGFDAQRDPWGEPWADLSEPYKTRRLSVKTGKSQGIFSGIQILVDKGELRRSIDNDTENIFAEGKNRAVFGTSQEYGKYHQQRREEGYAGKLPRRAFLPEDELLQEWFMPEFIDLLEQKIEGI